MNMRQTRILVFWAAFVGLAGPAAAQQLYVERLPSDSLAVKSPAERVGGEPGDMQVLETGCTAQSMTGVRQRIIDISLQEWAYFGFSVADETTEPEPRSTSRTASGGRTRGFPRGFSWLNTDESERLAGSIAGYWAITGDGSWIISRQNEVWNGSGIGARWRDPWSAAFISWVMCESGLGDSERFDRAINHHTYIDQAIRARDVGASETAYFAYDVGEQPIEPGDLLCAARRPTLNSLDERRTQLGDGIRSHCDIVVKLEPEHGRILAVGGNVRGSVSLKMLPADFVTEQGVGPAVVEVGRGRDRIFAHLKLRADPIENDALSLSPTLQRMTEEPELVERVRAVLDASGRTLSGSILL